MSPPRIAIDVTPLVGTRTGIGYAVADEVDALAQRPDDVTLRPFTLSRRARGHADLPTGTAAVPYPARLLLGAWARTDQPRIDRWVADADLIHATNYLAPPSAKPVVVSVHDCWFIRNRDEVRGDLRKYEPIVRRAIARGAWVHAISEYGANEARELLGSGERTRVVYLAVPEITVPPIAPPEVASVVDGPPFVLALGAQERRKNLVRLVEAFARAAPRVPDLCLVFAGPDGSASDAIDAAIAALPTAVAGRVVRLGTVTNAGRGALLGGAAALAFPSLDEGFGFPVLEAMSVGTPVLGPLAGAVPEVAGDAALLVDPLDVDAIADGLVRIVTDETLRATLIERGRPLAGLYTRERNASGLIDLYRDVLA